MLTKGIHLLKKTKAALWRVLYPAPPSEQHLLALGRLLAETFKAKGRVETLAEVEFSIFSQFGDDGIIQWLTRHLDFPHKTFIEFGVENYRESNTRFLMMNDHWSGMIMDGSESNIAQITGSEYYWKYDLLAKTAFIDKDNINSLLSSSGLGEEIGIFHIDIDGNDYWIWEQVQAINPVVVIMEYNAVFGAERTITVPYDKTFYRTRAHHSNLYFGVSLAALHHLATRKGYAFIGCTSAGNNAYFVRRDKLNDVVREAPLETGFIPSHFRESRDPEGRLTFLCGDERLKAIKGMPVVNVVTGQLEEL